MAVLSGCAHRAYVTGPDYSPHARIDWATFIRGEDSVVIEAGVALGSNEQMLMRAEVRCLVGAMAPPRGFRLVFITPDPEVESPVVVKQGYFTVHRCDEQVEFSGGWDVEGTIHASFEARHQKPNPPFPFNHVEFRHVTATEAPPPKPPDLEKQKEFERRRPREVPVETPAEITPEN